MDEHQNALTIDLVGDKPASATAPVSVANVPELREGLALDLPSGAVENADGSVTLTFEEKAVITYRSVGGADVRTEEFDHLVLHRLKGAQFLRVMQAGKKRADNLSLSLCTGVNEAKLALLYKAMDAADLTAARSVVLELLGGVGGDGLPDTAVKQDDGSITLPLLFEANDGEDEPHAELTFRKLRGDALIAIAQAKNQISTGLERSVGLSPKAASGLVDDMDAADVNAVLKVIGFLSGIGRTSGG